MPGSITTEFGFRLEYLDQTGQLVGDQRLLPSDFGHAIRHARFDAFRRGFTNHYRPVVEGVQIAPVFAESHVGSPRASGFTVTISAGDGCQHYCEFPLSYFSSIVNRRRAELIRNDMINGETELYYHLNAFLDDDQPSRQSGKLAISLAASTQRITACSGRVSDFGPSQVWGELEESDLKVLCDQGVAEEVVAEAREDPTREIGGFLLGQLRTDSERQEAFVVITGLASARGTTEANSTSVTFTPNSFVHARNMIQLRNANELICGWYHSHPFKLCAECPLPTPPECVDKVLFFSQDDIHLMETTFEQPFMVGLLTAVDSRIEEAVGRLPVKLFGWRAGEIKPRGFEVVSLKEP